MKNKIVLGTPQVDQTKVDLKGVLVVKKDYSIKIVDWDSKEQIKDVIVACQIGISIE